LLAQLCGAVLVDLMDATVDQTVDFSLGPAPRINGNEYSTSTTYLASMEVGTVVEYELDGIDAHPFHNHVNSFQIVADPADTASNYFRGPRCSRTNPL
jgi:FtsP/CotA-like multicopper oxidase with cupredoxin domain